VVAINKSSCTARASSGRLYLAKSYNDDDGGGYKTSRATNSLSAKLEQGLEQKFEGGVPQKLVGITIKAWVLARFQGMCAFTIYYGEGQKKR